MAAISNRGGTPPYDRQLSDVIALAGLHFLQTAGLKVRRARQDNGDQPGAS
jgi:hypothetical protein